LSTESYVCRALSFFKETTPVVVTKGDGSARLISLKGLLAHEKANTAREIPLLHWDIACDYALQVTDDSMRGALIFAGDYVFLKEDFEPADGDIIALELEGATVLKRVRFRGSDVVLKAENTEYDDIRMTKDQFAEAKILGKCVGFQSKLE